MIEYEIFNKSECDFSKLEPFGFVKNNDGYFYSCLILNNDFRVDVQISNSGEVKGKVIELAFDDEYTNYRVKNAGGFANNILTAFEEVLFDIRDKCFVKLYYENEQGELSFALLKKFGITWIRSQRRLPDKLVKEINKKEENNVN